ncbi:hypothetical protein WICPIJ_007125 [Wickerhamomyces pijperi]|uniref:Uncharacterized protein n=1 Tax=Wickerhamomyces pijperi TaxID=599730 RepID=A0A9P8TKC9_WICPI|nr:hypothetical protein WICPIJ_007125 [Wickerhamomyces pijperi]
MVELTASVEDLTHPRRSSLISASLPDRYVLVESVQLLIDASKFALRSSVTASNGKSWFLTALVKLSKMINCKTTARIPSKANPKHIVNCLSSGTYKSFPSLENRVALAILFFTNSNGSLISASVLFWTVVKSGTFSFSFSNLELILPGIESFFNELTVRLTLERLSVEFESLELPVKKSFTFSPALIRWFKTEDTSLKPSSMSSVIAPSVSLTYVISVSVPFTATSTAPSTVETKTQAYVPTTILMANITIYSEAVRIIFKVSRVFSLISSTDFSII